MLTERFDYDWAIDPDSYPCDADALLQFELLGALASISPTHPNLANHRTTAVRTTASGDFHSISVREEDLDFILVPHGYIALTRRISWALIRFHQAAWLIDSGYKSDGDLGGDPTFRRAIEIVGAQEPGIAHHIVGPIMQDAMSTSVREDDYRPPLLVNSLSSEERMMNGVGRAIEKYYHCSDAFVVLHELAHQLEGHPYGQIRDTRREVHADRAAISLAIGSAAGPLLGRYVGDDSLRQGRVSVGPASCIQLGRIFRLSHQFSEAYSRALQGDRSHILDLATSAVADDELDHRLVNVAPSMGLYKQEDHVPEMLQTADAFEVVRHLCIGWAVNGLGMPYAPSTVRVDWEALMEAMRSGPR